MREGEPQLVSQACSLPAMKARFLVGYGKEGGVTWDGDVGKEASEEWVREGEPQLVSQACSLPAMKARFLVGYGKEGGVTWDGDVGKEASVGRSGTTGISCRRWSRRWSRTRGVMSE